MGSYEYYQYCLIPNYVRKQIISRSSYTTRALTNGRHLAEIKIILPKNSKEQQAIAKALSDVDALISSLDGLIAKKGRILPLGSISNKTMVGGNESGYWMTYVSDQYGFRNPNDVYGAVPIDIVMVGDSYVLLNLYEHL